MARTYIAAVLIVLGALAGWLLVQRIARAFAARHPEFGPAREEGGGCGSGCGCRRPGPCRRIEEEESTAEKETEHETRRV